MTRIHRERDTGSHPDFQNRFAGLHIQITNGGLTPFLKHLSKHLILESRVGRIDSFNLFTIHVFPPSLRRIMPLLTSQRKEIDHQGDAGKTLKAGKPH